MANIKAKSIKEIELWNTKELRKLKITIKNRIESLNYSAKEKPLTKGHPLSDMSVDSCKLLLQKVLKAEKLLK